MNDVSETQITGLIDQVQIAHRLCAGFYKRLLPTLEQVARDSGFDAFWEWTPAETARPAPRANPAGKWVWDMLPMFATCFWYKQFGLGPAEIGDRCLVIETYIEDSFKKARRDAAGFRGEPDAIALPTGTAVVDIQVWRCVAPNGEGFEELYDNSDDVEATADSWTRCSKQLQTRRWQVSLASFLAKPEEVSSRIKGALAD